MDSLDNAVTIKRLDVALITSATSTVSSDSAASRTAAVDDVPIADPNWFRQNVIVTVTAVQLVPRHARTRGRERPYIRWSD